jgi:hypothetical protein
MQKSIYPSRFITKSMRQLSLEETKNIVSSYTKSYGQRGAARALNDQGYRSPEGYPLQQPHISRVLSGGCTCFLAPEEGEHQQQQSIEKPIAPIPKMQKRIAEELFADEELLQQEIAKTAAELGQELIEEQHAIEEMERSVPPLVPCTESRPYRERRHLEKDIKVSAIFDRRADIELDEELTFYGIPRLLKRKSVEVRSRPHQGTNFGANVLSTRDLNVRPKNRS